MWSVYRFSVDSKYPEGFFSLFLPDDSGSPIFILSSLSVGLVENMFGLRVGTGAGTVEIRKQIKHHQLQMRTNK